MNIRTAITVLPAQPKQTGLSKAQQFHMIKMLYLYSHFFLKHTPDDIEFSGLHPLVSAVVEYLKKRKQPRQALKAFIRALRYLEAGKFSPMMKLLQGHHGEELLEGLFACVATPEEFTKITSGILGWYGNKPQAIKNDYMRKTKQNIALNLQPQSLEEEYNEILMEEKIQEERIVNNKPQIMRFLSQNKDFFLSTYTEAFASWVEKTKCDFKPIVKQFSHELREALKVSISPSRTTDNLEIFKKLLRQIDKKPELMDDFLVRNQAFLVILNEMVHSMKIQECINQWNAIHPDKQAGHEKKANEEDLMEIDVPKEEKEKEDINKNKRKISNESTLFQPNKKSNQTISPEKPENQGVLKNLDLNL